MKQNTGKLLHECDQILCFDVINGPAVFQVWVLLNLFCKGFNGVSGILGLRSHTAVQRRFGEY
jgi:hypothetical protein